MIDQELVKARQVSVQKSADLGMSWGLDPVLRVHRASVLVSVDFVTGLSLMMALATMKTFPEQVLMSMELITNSVKEKIPPASVSMLADLMMSSVMIPHLVRVSVVPMGN